MARLSNLPTKRVLNSFLKAGWQIERTGHRNPKHTVLSKEGSSLILSLATSYLLLTTSYPERGR